MALRVIQIRPTATAEEVVVLTSALQALWPTPTSVREVKVDESWRFSRRIWNRWETPRKIQHG